jgi:hypothetical protein
MMNYPTDRQAIVWSYIIVVSYLALVVAAMWFGWGRLAGL